MTVMQAEPLVGRARRKGRRVSLRHDPLVDWLCQRFELSPFRFSLFFSILAFTSTCLVSALEGRLFSADRGILPLWYNFSTLLDFILLNPLAAYYILRSYKAIDSIEEIKIKRPSALLTTAIALAALGVIAIYFYRFLDGKFLDACFVGGDFRGVTATGWIVFFWTSLYLYLLLQCVYSQAHYISGILQLNTDRIDYKPFQADNSGGLRRLAQPAMEFLRVMVVLLFTIAIFFLYDFIVHGIKESMRWASVLVYLVVAPPVFLTPVISLHLFMVKARNRLLEPLNTKLGHILGRIRQNRLGQVENLAGELEALNKVRTEIRSFPIWPLPFRQIVESASYLLAPALTYLPTLLSLFKGD